MLYIMGQEFTFLSLLHAACGCDSDGSSDNLCDQSTGQCSCRPNVSGLKCDSCSPGHYNIQSGAGCLPCQCDPTGSESNMCDVQSGECSCRMGVAGPLCASCLEGYYGLSSSGCTGTHFTVHRGCPPFAVYS